MSRKKKKPTASPRRQRTAAGSTNPRNTSPRNPQHQGRSKLTYARYLWAVVTALIIAALLFEATMIMCIGLGVYMLSYFEWTGLWFLVGGYILACLPAAFGMLIATGQFWRSLTHALWIGFLYGALGFLFLDQIIAAL